MFHSYFKLPEGVFDDERVMADRRNIAYVRLNNGEAKDFATHPRFPHTIMSWETYIR